MKLYYSLICWNTSSLKSHYNTVPKLVIKNEKYFQNKLLINISYLLNSNFLINYIWFLGFTMDYQISTIWPTHVHEKFVSKLYFVSKCFISMTFLSISQIFILRLRINGSRKYTNLVKKHTNT